MENPNFQTLRNQKPLNRSILNLTGVITSGTSPRMQALVFLPLRGARVHIREIVIVCVYFLHPVTFLLPCAPAQFAPFDLFSCFMAQKTWFREIYVHFGVRTKKFNIFHYFSQKYAKFPIPAM